MKVFYEEFELKTIYSPEELIEINKEFLKVSKRGVDYSNQSNEYKVGYINGKAGRLRRGAPLHEDNTR